MHGVQLELPEALNLPAEHGTQSLEVLPSDGLEEPAGHEYVLKGWYKVEMSESVSCEGGVGRGVRG